MSTPARLEGRCRDCREPIELGQQIVTGEHGQWVHADCDDPDDGATETPETRRRDARICPGCHLTRPCGCEDET